MTRAVRHGFFAAAVFDAGIQAAAPGDNLTRENMMKLAGDIHDMRLSMLLSGISVSTGRDDYQPLKQMQLEKFDGNSWKLFGQVISGSGS